MTTPIATVAPEPRPKAPATPPQCLRGSKFDSPRSNNDVQRVQTSKSGTKMPRTALIPSGLAESRPGGRHDQSEVGPARRGSERLTYVYAVLCTASPWISIADKTASDLDQEQTR